MDNKPNFDNYLESLSVVLEKIEKGVIRKSDFEKEFSSVYGKVLSLFSQKEDEYHILLRWERENYIRTSISNDGSYAGEYEKKKVIDLIEQIAKISNLENKSTPIKIEKSFLSSEKEKANQYLLQLLMSAEEEILIYDGYLEDKDVGIFLPFIPLSVEIKCICGKESRFKDDIIKSRCSIFTNKHSHDRYICIDRKESYHLGASISTIGKSDFMINKIISPIEKKEKIEYLYSFLTT